MTPPLFRSRLRLTDDQRALLLAVLIGVVTGLLIVCFHVAIELIGWYSRGTPVGADPWRTVLSPVLGCTAAALLVMHVFPRGRGSGVIQTKAALYISDGYVPASAVVGKFSACAISLGSGAALGPEDPALHIGSGIASYLGRLFRLSRPHLRTISPVGAAAGIGAAFNTPITAVLFVVEEIIGAWNASVLGATVLAAVSAVVTARAFLGDSPLFRIPPFELRHPAELLVYGATGLIVGALSAAFIQAIRWLRRQNEKQPPWMAYVRPAGAGLLVGVIGVWMPQIMGPSYDAVDEALHGYYGWQWMLAFGLVKFCCTVFCFASGTPGGMFAPTLFIGATVGGGLGALASIYSPIPMSGVGSFVLVGIGTFFAGVFRAPITSIFMAFEVSGNYRILLPVMVANLAAYYVSRKMEPAGFFDMLARLEGLDLPSAEQLRERTPLRVEHAFEPGPAFAFSPGTAAEAALAELRRCGQSRRLAARRRGGWSWVSAAQLEDLCRRGFGTESLDNLLPQGRLPHLYPDMPLDTALRLYEEEDTLPVTSRAHSSQLLGVLPVASILAAYGLPPHLTRASGGPS
jgi:CIC family chloride channel protein